MKIFIPFKINRLGGTPTFVRKFKDQLIEKGYSVTLDFDMDFDVLFIVADSPIRYIVYAKLFGKKIVQRLDGVYHEGVSIGKKHILLNLKMKLIHNHLADYIIYQSEFSRLSCETMLGKRNCDYSIIYNGTKIPPYKTDSGRSNKIRLLTFMIFRRKDQIEPIIKIFEKMDKNRFSLDVIGSWTSDLDYIFKGNEPGINFLGKMENQQLLDKIKNYDIFLFSDQSACPNSVIEALSTGLPVVAYDRGSINELIQSGMSGEIVNLRAHDPFGPVYNFSNDDYENFAAKARKVSENLDFYKNNAGKLAEERFDLKKMISNYIIILKKICEKK